MIVAGAMGRLSSLREEVLRMREREENERERERDSIPKINI